MAKRKPYWVALTFLLAVQCVLAPMHIVGDDAVRAHERLVHGTDAPVVTTPGSDTHSHHHEDHGHGHHHHRSSDAGDDSHADGIPHHHDDHRHFVSDHEYVLNRTVLAKVVLVAVPNQLQIMTLDPVVDHVEPVDERIAYLPHPKAPPRRGPPSNSEFTRIV